MESGKITSNPIQAQPKPQTVKTLNHTEKFTTHSKLEETRTKEKGIKGDWNWKAATQKDH